MMIQYLCDVTYVVLAHTAVKVAVDVVVVVVVRVVVPKTRKKRLADPSAS